MTISIWRYSHLTLAVSSFLFILIATITGIILAIEPISYQLKPYAVNTTEITIAETLTALQNEHKEIITLQVNDHNFVSASVITKNGKSETFYVHPKSGKKTGSITPKAFLYKFATNLHRSLFLKTTGRILVAFFSLLLFLITITGIILITKRQGGFTQLFSKVIYENFNQFFHVILSRYFFIPIVIITLSGIYLSLDKFSILPKTTIKHNYNATAKNSTKKPITSFRIFKETKLSELKSLEFPFSDDKEEYFSVKLKTKELLVDQYSGEIISNQQLSWTKIVANWSLFLHTGRGSVFWSFVLLSTCFAILFFIYSGFSISIHRRKNNISINNKFKKNNAEFIILVGSEGNETFRTANSFYKALLKENKTVFIDNLNNYTTYKKAKNLIIFTSTYGKGEAPTNATNFLKLLEKTQQPNQLKYSVIGFGSLAYTEYCNFAIEIDNNLKKHSNFTATTTLIKINNQNFNEFKLWVLDWNKKTNNSLKVKQEIIKPVSLNNFKVISTTNLNVDDTFLIRLQPEKKLKFSSGDLLSIIPENDNVKRLYSIGKIKNDILLSIKKHEYGVCSQLLFNLNKNDVLKASIEKNKNFHFPAKAKEVILIANGTGIAPYLGMLNNTTKTHVFCGLRTKASTAIYKPYLHNKNIHYAFSKEENHEYIQDIIAQQEILISSVLKNKGVIMICGSVAMMNEVLTVLESITIKKLNKDLSKFKKQIKTDCY